MTKKEDKDSETTAKLPELSEEERNQIRKDAEALALTRVTKALNINIKDLEQAEKVKKQNKVMLYYNLGGMPVWVNGKMIPNSGKAPREQVEVWMHAAGSRRQRLLREKFSRKYEITMLGDGNFQSKLVGIEDELGNPAGGIG